MWSWVLAEYPRRWLSICAMHVASLRGHTPTNHRDSHHAMGAHVIFEGGVGERKRAHAVCAAPPSSVRTYVSPSPLSYDWLPWEGRVCVLSSAGVGGGELRCGAELEVPRIVQHGTTDCASPPMSCIPQSPSEWPPLNHATSVSNMALPHDICVRATANTDVERCATTCGWGVGWCVCVVCV